MKQSSQLNQKLSVLKQKELARDCSCKSLINRKVVFTKKTETFPVVETNLKPEDMDVLSTEMGEEIAMIVINKIVLLQSP
jgi:hypothetical protein